MLGKAKFKKGKFMKVLKPAVPLSSPLCGAGPRSFSCQTLWSLLWSEESLDLRYWDALLLTGHCGLPARAIRGVAGGQFPGTHPSLAPLARADWPESSSRSLMRFPGPGFAPRTASCAAQGRPLLHRCPKSAEREYM